MNLADLNLSFKCLLNLKQLAGNDDVFGFLGFSLDLKTAELTDELQKDAVNTEVSNPTMHHQIAELLNEYSSAAKKPRTGKLVKFRDFPGGIAYENAFVRKSVEPIAKGLWSQR